MQRISIIQQGMDGETKVRWLSEHKAGFEIVQVMKLPAVLPVVIDEPEQYLAEIRDTDLVMTFVTQADILEEIARWCKEHDVVLVASGQKLSGRGVFCPPICCALVANDVLGPYAKLYGAPVLKAKAEGGVLKEIHVKRGAPCGATWLAAKKVIGMAVEEGITRFGLEVQFNCTANPAGWDPLWGSSPVHTAAKVHSKALEHALDEELE